MTHSVEHGLFVEHIVVFINNDRAVYVVVDPVGTSRHVESNVPVCPADHVNYRYSEIYNPMNDVTS